MMLGMKRGETYYDILKVDKRASVAQIVSAYHAAKNAFSKDSVATYSLFNPEEAQQELVKLEEAYVTLTNQKKRHDYDKQLGDNSSTEGPVTPPTVSVQASEVSEEAVLNAPAGDPADLAPTPNEIKGGTLREIREKRGLSLEDAARITKIPSKFIKALEEDNVPKMPARVYIQGFVKNLATLYKLDPSATAKTYTAYLDSLKPLT